MAKYLVEKHAFLELYLLQYPQKPFQEELKSTAQSAPKALSPSNQESKYSFTTVDLLLDFVTMRWHERWVLADIWDENVLEVLSRRPFFLLVSIDAPVTLRWNRFKERCCALAIRAPTLEDFVIKDDDYLYNENSSIAKLTERAEVRLINSSSSLARLHGALSSLDLLDEQRLRPSWDQYFMQLASLAAQRSNCMKRRVGCVLVREQRVISTGYNGTPRNLKNCNQGGCEFIYRY